MSTMVTKFTTIISNLVKDVTTLYNQQILALRLLTSVLPHRIDDLEDRQVLLDRIFSLLGNTILTCANDPAITASSMCRFAT